MTHLHLARVTLQAVTPISSGSGASETVHDMALSRDASGLPRLQGATIQGVLRSLWREDSLQEPEETALFGFQGKASGAAGRLMVSDAAVHGSDDVAVEPRLTLSQIASDELLQRLAEDAPLRRDHVRLNARGVVQGAGKFERLAVPVGTRFSFELALWGDANDCGILVRLITLMTDPRFRLGGAVGRGYGAVTVKRTASGSAEIGRTKPDVLRDMRCMPLSRHAAPLAPCTPADDSASERPDRRGALLALALHPVGLWRIGAGDPDTSETEDKRVRPEADPHRLPDAIPLREWRVAWTGEQRVVEPGGDKHRYLIPGSSVKGVLAHRALFHLNRLEGRVLTLDGGDWKQAKADVASFSVRPNALSEIFGALRTGRGGERGEGQAGRLFIDDVDVTVDQVLALDHVAIDRFTGGARMGLLFSEEVAVGGAIELKLRLLPPRPGQRRCAMAIKALNAAIADICEGRLAIGAKSLGFCKSVGDPPRFPEAQEQSAPRQERAA